MDERLAFLRERPLRLATWLLLAGILLHLALASGTGLTPDEAHYALYGAHLDWSYFDHPGLVGWLQSPFVAAGGSDVQMRVVPMASWILAALLLCLLRRRLVAAPDVRARARVTTDDLGLLAVFFLCPLLNLLGVVLVPDSLLMPLVPAAMLATWSLREPQALAEWRRWAALSLVLGLCLLAKYTAVFIVFGALATLVSFHRQRLWRTRGLWAAVVVIGVLASPVLVWNARHAWISFAYQADHATGDQSWHLVSLVRALGLQLALFGPLIVLGVVAAWRARDREPTASCPRSRDARWMGLLFGLPVLVVFLGLAGRGSSLPHWTVCGWMALIPLACSGLQGLGRRTVGGAMAWQAVLIAVIVGVIASGGPLRETGASAGSGAGVRAANARPNPVADLYGWQAAATHAAALAQAYRARGLVVMNWSLASRLAWYARPLPTFVAPSRQDQFQLWFGALRPGDSAVVVDWSGMPLPIPTGPQEFAECQPIDQTATMAHDKQLAHFNFLHCTGWRGVTALAVTPEAIQSASIQTAPK